MIRMSWIPAPTACSITYWRAGLSTTGSISLGCDLVAGRNRVPRPAAGMTAFFTFTGQSLLGELGECIPADPRLTSDERRGPFGACPGAVRPLFPAPGTAESHSYNRFHADVRVRLSFLRHPRRGVPAVQRSLADGVRRLWRSPPQGVPSSRHPVQGVRLLRHGLPPREGVRTSEQGR